jgi:flagellar M-ring protein FliF
MALLGLVVLVMVVRPLVRRIVTPEGMEKSRMAAAAGMTGVAGAIGAPAAPGGAITNAGGPNVAIVGAQEAVAISNRTSAMIDVAKVQGQVHAQSVQKVGEIAEKNPHEAVSIIRTWLHEDAA